MKKKVIIFGAGDIAQLAHYYFTTDSDYEVAAFTVDKEYYTEGSFCDLPVVLFEGIEKLYPPEQYCFFIAMAYAKQNAARKEKYLGVKKLGYDCASYISSKATVLNNGNIGENCFVLENNVIQPFVEIGNNVTLWSGNHIGHHSVIEDHVFIASHVVVSGGVKIKEQCFIGVNATLRDHITIGERCVIGAGALLLSDVEDDGLYKGQSTVRDEIKGGTFTKI